MAPKKPPGKRRRLDETATRLLEQDLEQRPAATLSQRRQFLQRVAGVKVSDSTVSRMVGRMGWSRKKIGGSGRTRRVLESRLAGFGRPRDRGEALCVCGRVRREHLAFAVVRVVEAGRAGALLGAAQLGEEPHAAFEHEHLCGMGPSLAVEGSTTREVFEAYLEEVLAPTLLAPGRVVVMDNLSAHKGGRVREIVEGRGCELLHLPPYYSPDLNPIEAAFAKLKGRLRAATARTHKALVEAMGAALDAITASDVSGFFEHCGYRAAAQSL